MTFAKLRQEPLESDRPSSRVSIQLTACLERCYSVRPPRLVALYAEPNDDEPARVVMKPEHHLTVPAGYSLEHRFASWLASVDRPQLRTIPTFLSAWLPFKKALILPLRADGRYLGAVVVDPTELSRSDVERYEAEVTSLAKQLSQRANPGRPRADSMVGFVVESMRRIRVVSSDEP